MEVSEEDQKKWDQADPWVKQTAISHSSLALRALLKTHPELTNINSEHIALIFQAGAIMGMELAEIGAAADKRKEQS